MSNRKTATRLERRDISGPAPTVTDEGKIVGLAIPFNSWTTIGSGPKRFRERVSERSVTKTLSESDLVYLDNHDPAKPVARLSAGTLEVARTERGVEYVADPNDTTYAQDLVKNIRSKNILGNSFGFEVVKDKWEIGDDGVDERTLLEIKLPEISACTFPAYGDTEIGMRYAVAMEARDRYYEGRAGDAPGDGSKPYGNVTYADPGYQKDGKKRYPVDTKKHVQAAWSYINKAKNAGRYTAEQLAKIKAKIKSAAKKFGVTISSDRSFEDFDLRGYDPLAGFMETRDDPDGKEYAAMQEAIAHLDNGDYDAARQALQSRLDEAEDYDEQDGEAYAEEDSDGQVAHTNQGGAAVPLRAAERIYELIRQMPATAVTNEALALLEPQLSTPESEERGTPKPETSTSGIALGSDEGAELWKRMNRTQRDFRP